MLMIKKRSGIVQPFSPQKLKTALASTSDEIGRPFNESDLNDLVGDVQRILEGKETASSWDVYIIVLGLLYNRGFSKILESYAGYRGNAWR